MYHASFAITLVQLTYPQMKAKPNSKHLFFIPDVTIDIQLDDGIQSGDWILLASWFLWRH